MISSFKHVLEKLDGQQTNYKICVKFLRYDLFIAINFYLVK